MGLRQEENSTLFVGQAYHAVLEKIARLTLAGQGYETHVLPAMLLFDEPWRSGFAKYGLDRDQIVEEIGDNVERLVAMNIWHPDRLFPLVQYDTPMIERKWYDDALGFQGVIDLVSANTPITSEQGAITGWKKGEPCVLDWKSLTSERRRTDRDCRLSGQLALYAIVSKIPNVGFIEVPRNLEREINFRVMEFPEHELKFWRVWFDNMRQHLLGLRKIADAVPDPAMMEAAMKDFFPMCPRSNGLCQQRFCPAWDKCYPMETNGAPGTSAE